MEKNQLLQVDNLSIAFISEGYENEVISNISFHLSANEILGIVGESGSGKSVSSLAIMGLLPNNISKVNSGTISFYGELLSEMDNKSLQLIRGKSISMIFQEPMSSLNPSMSCGKQVREILLQHTEMSKKEAYNETITLFEKVKLPDPSRAYNAFPHEISGGQKQRVMIAMAIACKPQVLIADEPTTALDVTVQKEIMALLKSLQKDTGMSIIFISHDLSLVSEIADRVVVMYKGKIIEEGFVRDVFLNPKELYTKALIKSRPSMESRLKILPTIDDFVSKKDRTEIISDSERNERHKNIYAKKPLLELKNLEKEFFSKSGWFTKTSSFKAVDRVSFKLYPGETLGLVGESGCGKSTLSNAILQLDKATAGSIIYKGQDITHLKASEIRQLRKEIQIIFQDPYASLNPRLTVGQAILEPMQVHGIGNSKEERIAKVLDLLKKVGLDQSYFNRYPHEFSGGQRQRIGIARTIAVEPQLIICDESVSALDISVQAQVLNLLNELKDNFGFTYIFISHDLAVVKYMSDQLVVMNKGQIEEMNDADHIYSNPEKAYTKKLIHAIPKGL